MKNILVISKKNFLVRKICATLPKKEIQVQTTTETGEKLKSNIEQISPDLIVIDAEIAPQMGIGLSLFIRQWSVVPLLILSTINTKSDEIRCIDMKSFDLLSEPIKTSLIAMRINSIFSERMNAL
jgi:DNA-binding response OmpR family regulator